MTTFYKQLGIVMLFVALCYGAFGFGTWTTSDRSTLPGGIGAMPTVDLIVVATHSEGTHVAVRRTSDGALKFLKCFGDCPIFEVGRPITVERWKAYYSVDYIYRRVTGPGEVNYSQEGWTGETDDRL